MGVIWRTNYDRFLHILFHRDLVGGAPRRPAVSFTSSSGTYTPDTDVDLKLANSGSTWTLTDQDDTVETYTQSNGLGTLNSIKKRGGYLQALSYSSSQISFVSDSYSRTLGFTYSSAGLLTGVSTPDSLSLSYGYIAFAKRRDQSALHRHLQHQPDDPPDLPVRKRQLSLRPDRHHRRERQPLYDLGL